MRYVDLAMQIYKTKGVLKAFEFITDEDMIEVYLREKVKADDFDEEEQIQYMKLIAKFAEEILTDDKIPNEIKVDTKTIAEEKGIDIDHIMQFYWAEITEIKRYLIHFVARNKENAEEILAELISETKLEEYADVKERKVFIKDIRKG